jgi:hypothetical protein
MNSPIKWFRAYLKRPRCPICEKRHRPDAVKFNYGTCSPACLIEAQHLTFVAALMGINPWKVASEQR